MRFMYSGEQGYDTSCGISACVTYLNRYWNIECNESAIAEEFLYEKIRNGDYTVSIADLKIILEAKGFTTKAFKMNTAQLKKALIQFTPIIVHYNKPDGHFVLVLACVDNSFITADPAAGLVSLTENQFTKNWSGYTLLSARKDMEMNKNILEDAITLTNGKSKLAEQIMSKGGIWK